MTALVISVPEWLDEIVARFAHALDDDEQRMALAVALARHNVEHGGGPFGAVVFSGPDLVGVGVNRVLDTGFSIAHAEILALSSAQRRTAPGHGESLTLVTSTEPCCQCFGALIWAGVTRLVCGATTADAEAVGFDEGPKPEAWPEVLERRGISVTLGVGRTDAQRVLEDYQRRGGTIYGLRR